ncbi:glycosyltransferase [Geomonas nitrogeniifigens]|uniref:Glycosyltransferase n=1 Tax=Geomonas diazotrophica TaxID=2843197 RepID=A0ABX8JFJ4_9BACT|nr:glycosyltransferase [Geomonas nitrogeniifigens]QWV95962.1 glycosyltransferase [Geomonas nitrogeniifigens]
MYDYIFITHLPAFYKVNLYNELHKRLKIFVVFVASSSAIRTPDFIGRNCEFEHAVLHEGDFETRPQLSTSLKVFKILSRLKYKKVVVGGWDLVEFWVTVLTNPRCRNVVTVESTLNEGANSSLKQRVKTFFISRIASAFPSGRLHQQLLSSLGFRGASYFTGGVGMFNRVAFQPSPREFSAAFLYVGRLSPEKNLLMLVEVFKELPEFKLTIVGAGPIEQQLKAAAPANVTIITHVPNEEISEVYCSHDVFILPSLREPWGLVIDEALFFGLPVIVSRNVGCHTELISDGVNGLLFDAHDRGELSAAVQKICKPGVYAQMRCNVLAMDFTRRDEEQLQAYERAIL